MRTIGLLGGMSWHSSAGYYRIINEEVAARLGGHHSASLLLASLDFAEIRAMQQRDAWDEAATHLASTARRLQDAGADLVVLCSNLMHKAAPQIEAALEVPFLHIADAVGHRAAAAGHARVGLLGARWVMEEPFYADRLARRHGIEVVVPQAAGRALVDRVIFTELTLGRVEEHSRAAFVDIVGELADRGAEAVVLGCTEIELLLREATCALPVLDSMRLHATAAAVAATGG